MKHLADRFTADPRIRERQTQAAVASARLAKVDELRLLNLEKTTSPAAATPGEGREALVGTASGRRGTRPETAAR